MLGVQGSYKSGFLGQNIVREFRAVTCWSTRASTCQIILCNDLKEANQILIIVVFLSGINREIWTIDRCLTGLLGQLLVKCSGQLQARIPRTEYYQGIQGCYLLDH